MGEADEEDTADTSDEMTLEADDTMELSTELDAGDDDGTETGAVDITGADTGLGTGDGEETMIGAGNGGVEMAFFTVVIRELIGAGTVFTRRFGRGVAAAVVLETTGGTMNRLLMSSRPS